MHHRADAPLPGVGEQHIVFQGDQAAVGIDPICKRRQFCQIGQFRIQKRRGNKGVGVAVKGGRTQLVVKVGDHQGVTGLDRRTSLQKEVVLPQGPDCGPIAVRNGV